MIQHEVLFWASQTLFAMEQYLLEIIFSNSSSSRAAKVLSSFSVKTSIPACFTRPTRSINHRAIAEIRTGKKHAAVKAATVH